MADSIHPAPAPVEVPRRPPWSCSCGRRWTSLTQAHCTLCHEHFATVNVSDKHQTFDPQRRATCHAPAQVRTKKGERVYRLSEESEGPVWRSFARAPEVAWGDR